MQVDHIIPERLLDHPNELDEALHQLGRSNTFNINSYENWLPACGPCNNRKRGSVFSPAPIIVIELDRASKKASEASALEAKTVNQRDVNRALNLIERALDQGELELADNPVVARLIDFHRANRDPEQKDEPIRLTPLYEVLSDDGWRMVVQGPYGAGVRPSGDSPHGSWDCPHCGAAAAWNGARCVICGMMDDD
jgi:hypothetical protein